MAVPALNTTGLPMTGGRGDKGKPPTPHANTGRRLSKSIMRADSQNEEGSKAWGMLTMRDHTGEHKAVRVVQNEAYEDSNMVKVTWFWTWESLSHTVRAELGRARHRHTSHAPIGSARCKRAAHRPGHPSVSSRHAALP